MGSISKIDEIYRKHPWIKKHVGRWRVRYANVQRIGPDFLDREQRVEDTSNMDGPGLTLHEKFFLLDASGDLLARIDRRISRRIFSRSTFRTVYEALDVLERDGTISRVSLGLSYVDMNLTIFLSPKEKTVAELFRQKKNFDPDSEA